MKVAIISDIHGNMQALEKVLEDIKTENCDKIFCLGDIAMAGPEPVKVTELITLITLLSSKPPLNCQKINLRPSLEKVGLSRVPSHPIFLRLPPSASMRLRAMWPSQL